MPQVSRGGAGHDARVFLSRFLRLRVFLVFIKNQKPGLNAFPIPCQCVCVDKVEKLRSRFSLGTVGLSLPDGRWLSSAGLCFFGFGGIWFLWFSWSLKKTNLCFAKSHVFSSI
jgi:hypothetical protein